MLNYLTIRTELCIIPTGVVPMEKRVAKVNFCSVGGTAASGARTCKVTLPTSWINAMGINMERRELELSFNGTQIVLSPRLTGEEFTSQKLEQNHDVRLFRFFHGDELCSTIYVDFTDETLIAENHVNDPVITAFGNNALPVWADFQLFLEERCVPRERDGLREYLEAIGVGGYEPIEIIRKTCGRMAGDNQWIKIEAPAKSLGHHFPKFRPHASVNGT